MRYTHKGGIYGYFCRRILHVSMVFIPLLYYWYGQSIASVFYMSRTMLVKVILVAVWTLEWLRIRRSWIILGQREYEAKQISAFAWGTLGLTLVLLAVPEIGIKGAALGFPIIASLSLVDPLLGELRRWNSNKSLVVIVGFFATLIIWGCSAYWLDTPLWLTIFVVPATLAAELYKVPKIDDNFLMATVPLVIVLILYYFVGF